MPGKRHGTEQILRKLREVEVALSRGETVARAVRQIGVTEQADYRWRNEYGGLSIDQAKKLKKLALENARLRRAVADLILDKRSCGYESHLRHQVSSGTTQAHTAQVADTLSDSIIYLAKYAVITHWIRDLLNILLRINR